LTIQIDQQNLSLYENTHGLIHKFSHKPLSPKFKTTHLSSLRFRLDAHNCDECMFDLNEYTGHLSVQRFDREHLSQIWLNISVYDTNKLFTPTSTLLWLNILDVNDNMPRFSQNQYIINIDDQDYFSLNENGDDEENFVLIFNENALDDDAGSNGTLTYELIDTKYDMFYVETNNGKIWMARGKAYERIKQNVYDLRLLCKDNGNPSFKYTIVDIIIKVTDCMNCFYTKKSIL
jgi:hypothetical protein